MWPIGEQGEAWTKFWQLEPDAVELSELAPPVAPAPPAAWSQQPTVSSAMAFPSVPAAGYGPVAAPAGDPRGDPRWRLVLSQGARRLMVFFIILGIALNVVGNIFQFSANGGPFHGFITRLQAQVATSQLQSAFTPLNDAVFTWQSAGAACSSSPTELACLRTRARSTANAFGDFMGGVDAITEPSAATAAADTVTEDASQAQEDFGQLAGTTGLAQFQAMVGSLDIQQVLSQFEHDYQALLHELNVLE